MDQTTFAADIRADWIITLKLSFQVYLQPLIASGKYSNYKSLTSSKFFEFDRYGENGSTIEKEESDHGSINYYLDADGDGAAAIHL